MEYLEGDRIMRQVHAFDLIYLQIAAGPLFHGLIYRVVFIDKNIIEQRRTPWQVAPALHLCQWTVFVLPRFHLTCLQLSYIAADRLIELHAHPYGQGVNEQSHHFLNACDAGRATCNCRSENNVTLTTVAAQQQCPCRLHDRVQSDLLALRKPHQFFSHFPVCADCDFRKFRLDVARISLFLNPKPRWGTYALKLFSPEAFGGVFILITQPPYICAICRRRAEQHIPALAVCFIYGKDFGEDGLARPAIEQHVMIAAGEVAALAASAHKRKSHQRGTSQIKASLPVFRKMMQPFLSLVRVAEVTPVLFLP